MNGDIQVPITIEVTVPRIIPPLLNEQSQRELARDEQIIEQVRLLPGNTQQKRHPAAEHDLQVTNGEASTYTTRTGLFHLFRLQAVFAQRKTYLLQILRQRQGRKEVANPTRGGKELLTITDELAFTLECHSTISSETSTQPVLTPGRNHLVIVFNEEGTPDEYSIDGAER